MFRGNMMLDIKTITLLNFFVNLINAIVLVIIWRQYRKHFAGLWLFMVDMILQTIGFFLIFLRGTIPDFISIVIS
jgi:hypothetical protein